MPDAICGEDVKIKDYVNVIIKRKKIVLSMLLLVMTLSAFVTYLIPKTYEVKALVQMGFLNTPLANYSEASVLLRSRYILEPICKKLGINENVYLDDKIKDIIILEEIKNTDYFILKVRFNDKELSYLLIRELLDAYVDYGNSKFNVQSDLMKKQLARCEDLIERTKSFIGSAQDIPVAKNLSVSLNFPDNKVQLKDLFIQKFQLESQLSTAKEFNVVDIPARPSAPISPNIIKNMVFSCYFGLILGVFTAFYSESLKKSKK